MIIKTTRNQQRYSRRHLLRSLGLSGALLPLLSTDRAARAQAEAPKRLVTIVWPNGVAQPHFYPTGTNPTDSTILKPLAPFAAKTTVVAGLDLKVMLDDGRRYDGHFSYPSLFTGTYRNVRGQTGTATGPSLDQHVATELGKKVSLQIPLLNMVAAGQSTSYRGDNQRNTGETDPNRLYNNVFASRAAPADDFAALRGRRASVLDFVNQEMTAFRERLGTDDRRSIDAHHESLRSLEKELETLKPVSCSVSNPTMGTDFANKVRAFMRLTALAIRCDLNRAASITLGDNGGSNPTTMAFMGVGGDAHGIAHEGAAGYTQKTRIDTWFIEQIAILAKELDDVQEANGKTALDNTVILAASDMSEGSRHDVGAGIPVVLIGNAGGAFRAGRVIKVGTWAGKNGSYWQGLSGAPHNRLLASVATAVGVPTPSFGARYTGTLPELDA